MATKLGDAYVEMSAKDNQLAKDLSKAQSKVEKSATAMSAKLAGIGKGMAIAGAAITAALGTIITKTAAVGDKFDKMSLRTGISVEALSSLAYAADISGASIETMEKGLKGLTMSMNDMSLGMGEAKDAYETLGVAVTDTDGNLRSTVDVFKEIATKISAIENPTLQASLAMDIFGGRAGPQLIPLLKMGEKGIDELMKKAEELNITISTESAKAAADFTDAMTRLKGSLAGAGRMIGDTLIPALTPLIEKVTEIVGKVTAWIKENPELTATITKVVAAAGALMLVLGPLFMMLPGMVTAFGAVSGAIAAIGTITSGPIGWCIAAVIGLALAWKTNFLGIRDFTLAVVGKVTEALGWLWDKVKWVLEKLGLYEEKIEEIGEEAIYSAEKTAALAKATKEAGERSTTAATGVDALTDSMSGLAEKTDEAKGVMDEFGNFLETFDEWVKRTGEETKTRNEEMVKSKQGFADAMQPIYDRLYEMSHTEEEIAVRSLTAQKDAQIAVINATKLSVDEKAAAITKITELYNAEVGLIIAKIEEEKEAKKKEIEVTVTGELAKMKAIREGMKPYDELIAKVNEVATATEESVARQVRALRTVTDTAGNVTLTNLPPQQSTGSYEEAQAIVAGNAPTYATGTPYVPRTELAVVHKGEKITPANQNTNNNSYSPSIVVNVSGNGNSEEIKQAVEQALTESTRQFNRSGNVLIPGMA